MKQLCLMMICCCFTFNCYTGELAASEPKTVWVEPMTGMEFVWVPGGTYRMGTPEGATYENEPGGKTVSIKKERFFMTLARAAAALLPVGCVSSGREKIPVEGFDTSDERPVHDVKVKGFWIGKTEVTQAQWKKIFNSGPSYFHDKDDHPVESVSWKDTKAFIKELNSRTGQSFRLPTEEEWEYAARSGGKPQRYSGGDLVGDVAWFRNNIKMNSTHKVATKKPNGLGIHDMSGNVWEWCEDRYVKDAYMKKISPGYVSKFKEEGRVCRGGCYLNTWPNVRCSNRNQYPEDYKFLNLGFRLVKDKD